MGDPSEKGAIIHRKRCNCALRGFCDLRSVIGFARVANHRASPAPINRLPGHSFQKRVREKRGGEKNILSAF